MQSAVHSNPVIPETGFLRLSQIIGNKKAKPPTPPLIPISRSAWWKGIQEGRYPRGVKLSKNTTAWKAEDIRALINKLGEQSEGGPKDAA